MPLWEIMQYAAFQVIHINAMFGIISIRLWSGIYTRANTGSYKELEDKNERFWRANILWY